MRLEDQTLIHAGPERVFAFFEAMEERYRTWHPDHVRFRWVKGRGLSPGVEFYFEEYIAGKLLKKRVRVTEVVPDRYFAFAPTWWLMRLFLPRLSFAMTPEEDATRFTAQIHVRMGPLAAWLNRREIAAVRQHMREEGQNLKRILEEAPAPSGA